MTTLGCHNLLDGKGSPTPFADVLLFTESHPLARLSGYQTWVCDRQRDLSICVVAGLLSDATPHYKRVHWGIRKVTPNRGTFWLTGTMDGEKTVIVVEHRINAAFAPFKRGEGLFRKTMWEMHTRASLRIIKRLKAQGYRVLAGGDLNTPRGVSGYRGVLKEAGDSLDRLGATSKLTNVQHLSRMGSDHPRLKATVA